MRPEIIFWAVAYVAIFRLLFWFVDWLGRRRHDKNQERARETEAAARVSTPVAAKVAAAVQAARTSAQPSAPAPAAPPLQKYVPLPAVAAAPPRPPMPEPVTPRIEPINVRSEPSVEVRNPASVSQTTTSGQSSAAAAALQGAAARAALAAKGASVSASNGVAPPARAGVPASPATYLTPRLDTTLNKAGSLSVAQAAPSPQPARTSQTENVYSSLNVQQPQKAPAPAPSPSASASAAPSSASGPVRPSVRATIDPSAPKYEPPPPPRPPAREAFTPEIAPSIAATMPRGSAASATAAPPKSAAGDQQKSQSSGSKAASSQVISGSGVSRLLVPDVTATVKPGTVILSRRAPQPRYDFQGSNFAGTKPDVRATLPPSVTDPFLPAPAAVNPPPVLQPKSEKDEDRSAKTASRRVQASGAASRVAVRELRVLKPSSVPLKVGSAAATQVKVRKAAASATPHRPAIVKLSETKAARPLPAPDKSAALRVVGTDGKRKLLASARISTRIAGLTRGPHGRLVSILQH